MEVIESEVLRLDGTPDTFRPEQLAQGHSIQEEVHIQVTIPSTF